MEGTFLTASKLRGKSRDKEESVCAPWTSKRAFLDAWVDACTPLLLSDFMRGLVILIWNYIPFVSLSIEMQHMKIRLHVALPSSQLRIAAQLRELCGRCSWVGSSEEWPYGWSGGLMKEQVSWPCRRTGGHERTDGHIKEGTISRDECVSS